MEHKFKVGDKVKVHYLMGNRIGYIQERKSELRYDIRYDEGCIGHDIEENRIVKYNGNQDMEINVGDKVRVREDAPRMYVSGLDHTYLNVDSTVIGIEDGNAVIRLNSGNTNVLFREIALPTKYLIKVEDEAKEPKFKVNDVVRTVFNETTHVTSVLGNGNYYLYGMGNEYPEDSLTLVESYTEPTAPTIKVGDFVKVLENLHEPICLDGDLHLEITNITPNAISHKEWKVVSVEMRRGCAGRIYTLKHDNSFIYNIPQDCVELVQSKEQTEEKQPMDLTKEVANNLSNALEGCCNAINNIANNFDWDAYTANLARDIAVKIVNKNMDSDPEKVGEYAANVAKSVVEELKKK